MRASIIIAAHNEGDRLTRTLGSIVETAGKLDYEMIVADDASVDGSIDEVRKRFSRARIVQHSSRKGASATKALGADQAQNDIFVFLDGHVKPEAGALERLVGNIERLSDSVVVTPQIVALNPNKWRNDPRQAGYGYGLDLESFDCWWITLPRMNAVWRQGRQLYESPALIGCALALHRDLYHRLWGFDRDMRSWGVEDLDFGLKAWLMGYPILHDPNAVVGHRFQQDFDNYTMPIEDLISNQLRTARKHFSESIWSAWVAKARERFSGASSEWPEGPWARAWEIFQKGRASAEVERGYLHANRIRDELWYAERFGQPWPRLETGARESLIAREAIRPAARPSPSPTPCTITSQTVATIPANRNRTTIGVGEEIALTFSQNNAAWSLTGPGSLSANSGKTVIFTASATPGTARITANGSSPHCTATIQFTIIAPSGVTGRRAPGTAIRHTKDRPDSGFKAEMYLTPDTVSFQFLSFKELDVPAVATGVYAPFNGVGHHPNPAPITIGPVVPGLGSKMNGIDNIYSGDPGTAAPFAPGAIAFAIPWQFQLQSGGPFVTFATVNQRSALAADAKTLTSAKAGANVSAQISDPTSGP
jgi:GT2 family glycosyltransferase